VDRYRQTETHFYVDYVDVNAEVYKRGIAWTYK